MASAPSIDLGTKQLNNGAGVMPTAFGYYPQEGSRVCSLAYNWSTSNAYREDLSQLKSLGVETTIQSAFIDNSQNPAPVTIQVDSSQQVLVIPAYSQGVMPLFFGENAAYWISCTANNNIATKVIMLNVPANTASVWPVGAANSGLNANGVQTVPLIGTQAFYVNVGTSLANVVIPAVAGKRFFITGVTGFVRNNANAGAAVEVEFTLTDGAAVVLGQGIYIPATGLSTPDPIAMWNISQMSYISQAQNQALDINLSSVLASNSVDLTVFGGYTTQTP